MLAGRGCTRGEDEEEKELEELKELELAFEDNLRFKNRKTQWQTR
jgi:hypothetical protein